MLSELTPKLKQLLFMKSLINLNRIDLKTLNLTTFLSYLQIKTPDNFKKLNKTDRDMVVNTNTGFIQD